MNKLVPTFLFVLLGLSALLFYKINQLQRDLDAKNLAITRLDNRLFKIENQNKGLRSAQGDEFTSQMKLNLSDAPAKFKQRPYCQDEGGEIVVRYSDMETSRYREWRIESEQSSFSPEDEDKLDVDGSFVISGYYILVDVTDKQGDKIKARFAINDMEDNGDIIGYHINSEVTNLESCPEFVNKAFY